MDGQDAAGRQCRCSDGDLRSTIKACPATPNLANSGTLATQETGPATQRRRPIETFRSALTMAGSNWLPAQRVSPGEPPPGSTPSCTSGSRS